MNDNYRLYLTVIDYKNRQLSEGPYTFPTAGDALDWLRKQTHINVLSATLWRGGEKIAEAT